MMILDSGLLFWGHPVCSQKCRDCNSLTVDIK